MSPRLAVRTPPTATDPRAVVTRWPWDGRRRAPGAAACAVWWSPVVPAEELVRLLPPAERDRAAQLAEGPLRDRFVTGRAVVRRLLAVRLGTAAHRVPLDETCHRCGADHGKPVLAGPRGRRSGFNLTHTGRWVALALTDGPPVGIDAEVVRDRSAAHTAALLDAALSPAERADHEQRGERQRSTALLRSWTRKEAVLKATGVGLAIAPSELTVSAPSAPPILLRHPGDLFERPGMAAVVQLRDLPAPPSVVASLCVLSSRRLEVLRPRVVRWTSPPA
jgi:4'-phosphopantetheinyl transferase